MPHPQSTDSSQAAPSRKWVWRLLIGVAVLLVLIGLPWSILELTSRGALDRQIAAMKAAGEPLSLAEYYDRLPPLPDDQNSARIIESLTEELDSISNPKPPPEHLPFFGKGILPAWSDPWHKEMLTAINEFLTTNAELIARIDPIQHLPRGRFHLELKSNPIAILLPNLAPLRTAANVEVLAAINDAAAGKQADALVRCRTILNLSAAVREEPILISSLVSASIDARAVSILERLLAARSAAPELLASLQDLLHDHDLNSPIPTGLRGERLGQMGIHEFIAERGPQSISNITGRSSLALPKGFNWLIAGLFRLSQAKTLELLAPLIDSLNSPKEAMEVVAEFDRKAGSLGPQYIVAKIILPSLTRCVTLWARQLAELRCARTGLAAERFRIATGKWPETLDELAPRYLDAVPLDPFDEEPLRYRVDPDKITIYSIHENKADDGGKIDRSPRWSSPSPDVGFRLLNPELRAFRIEESGETDGD